MRRGGFKTLLAGMNGFTLAELLISLAILGVIATFTIPKVLQSQQSGQWNATGKEAIAMISEAFQIVQLENGITASTGTADLTPYLNYVAMRTSGTVDDWYTGAGSTCTSASPCFQLHNGAVLGIDLSETFSGMAANYSIQFLFDPDGTYSGSTNGPGKSLVFVVYTTGEIRTPASLKTNTYVTGAGPYGPDPSYDPPWFSWDR